MKDPNFVLWLWRGDTMYGPGKKTFVADHVNRMASMIRRNWPGFSGKIICVTDMPEGIRADVDIVPLWDDLRQYGKCYTRLRCFDPAIASVLGDDIISIDLDAVIMGDLRPLFDGETEPFRIWRIGRESRSEMCGSLWRLKIGYAPGIFESFDPEVALNLRKTHGLIGSDQAWMAYKLRDAPGWTDKDGIYSFRFDFAHAGQAAFAPAKRKELARRAAAIPHKLKRAKIIFFHGPFCPSQTHLHIHHKWIPANWV